VSAGGEADGAPASQTAPNEDEDMAESHFPQTNRGSVVQSMLVLSGMLAICTLGILGILKQRDLHR